MDPFYEKNVSNFAMVFIKLSILFGLPVFSYCFLKWNRAKIYTIREFDTAYGTLYQNLKNSESIHLVVTIFCMRRMFIAISTIFGNQASVGLCDTTVARAMGSWKLRFSARSVINNQ